MCMLLSINQSGSGCRNVGVVCQGCQFGFPSSRRAFFNIFSRLIRHRLRASFVHPYTVQFRITQLTSKAFRKLSLRNSHGAEKALKTAKTAFTSSIHFIEGSSRTIVSESIQVELSNMPSTTHLSNEDSNSSDALVSKFKNETNHIMDESSNSSNTPLSKLKSKKIIFDENSNSSDVPLSSLKKLTGEATVKTPRTGANKRKRALSSDEESVESKARRTKKDPKESQISGSVKPMHAAKNDEKSSAFSDNEIFPSNSRLVTHESNPQIDSELESGSNEDNRGNYAEPKSEKSRKKVPLVETSERSECKFLEKFKAKRTTVKAKKQIELSSSSSGDDLIDSESSASSASDGNPAVNFAILKTEKRKENMEESSDMSYDHPVKENALKKESKSSSSSSDSSNESDNGNKENTNERNKENNYQPTDGKIPNKGKKKGGVSTSDLSELSDSDEEQDAKESKPTDANKSRSIKQVSGAKKKKVGDSSRILRLQRYLKEAGIRVASYKNLWEGCKSDKAKAAKLLGLLEEHGLLGKPSLSECRKLRKKLEREREVAELNTANIIQSTGRPRRSAQSLYATSAQKNEEETISIPKKSPEFKKAFSRLKAIVDSEDSD